MRSAFVTLLAVSSLHAESPAAADIGVAGNDRILWVYENLDEADGGKLVRFAYRPAESRFHGGFFPQAVGPVTGHVVHAAVRGHALHVFFGDGSHWRYAPGRPVSSLVTPPERFPEANLVPGKRVQPLAISADEARGVLYAVVAARDAVEIEELRVVLVDEAGLEGAEAPGITEPALAPEPLTDRVIVRYEEGVWMRDRDAPADLALEGRTLQLLVDGGAIDLFYSPDGEGPSWLHRRSPAPEGEWSASTALPIVGARSCFAAGRTADSTVLLVAEPEEGGATIRSFRLTDDGCAAGPELTDAAGDSARFTRPVAVALFMGNVLVAGRDSEGVVRISRWSLDNGALLEAPAVVAPLAEPAFSRSTAWSASRLLQYGVLIGALAVVFIWRRDSIVRPARLEPDQALARLTRRAAALVIDLIILFPFCALLAFALLADASGEFNVQGRLASWMRSGTPGAPWAGAVLGGILGAYAMVFEGIGRATPGKKLLGLTVVREEGGRCSAGNAVVRNIVRVIEFHFPPVILLLAVTVNCQRLGDLMARTVVVELTEPLPTERQESDEDDGQAGE